MSTKPTAKPKAAAQSTDDVLLPYQKKWLTDTSQVKICEKSRRVGLSWSQASSSVIEAAKADGRWDAAYAPIRLASAASIPEDLRAAIEVPIVAAGGIVESEYDVPADAWYFAANRQNSMPLAVLLEVPLQSCGFLAASTIPHPPMRQGRRMQ